LKINFGFNVRLENHQKLGVYSLGLKADGSIVGWGENEDGQANPHDGNDFVAIAAGYDHGLALAD
jgi:hypothetical protein